MQTTHDINAAYRLICQLDELDAGIDPEFDNAREELEREFAEIRLQLETHH
jgi:hypothetical protein